MVECISKFKFFRKKEKRNLEDREKIPLEVGGELWQPSTLRDFRASLDRKEVSTSVLHLFPIS